MFPYLPHMTNIEHASFTLTTTPKMFFHDTTILALIQNGKLIPSERYNITAKILVQVVQGSLDQ